MACENSWVGSLNHTAELKTLIDSKNLSDCITLVGAAFGDEKERLLTEASAFILPSFSEGLPMSVLEAWAYALPVVITPHCNLPEEAKQTQHCFASQNRKVLPTP